MFRRFILASAVVIAALAAARALPVRAEEGQPQGVSCGGAPLCVVLPLEAVTRLIDTVRDLKTENARLQEELKKAGPKRCAVVTPS